LAGNGGGVLLETLMLEEFDQWVIAEAAMQRFANGVSG
jgi:hypothetical protein